MRTEELIEKLSKQSHPVMRLASPTVRLLRWLGAALFCVGIGVLVFGFRSDIQAALKTPAYAFHTALIFMLGILSAMAAFSLSVPNQELPSKTKMLPLVALGGWLVYLIIAPITGMGAAGSVGLGLTCIRDIVIIALPPGLLLFVMIAKAAPIHLRLTGAFISLSVAAFGAFGTQLICRNDGIFHVLTWHFVPVLFLGGAGALLGQMLGRWEKRL